MRRDRHHADRALALERAEPFVDARRCRAKAAATSCDLDRDQLAVLRIPGRAARDDQLAAKLLLVNRREPAAAVGLSTEETEHARLGAIDDLDDASGIASRIVGIADLFDPQQGAVADAGALARLCAAVALQPDLRRRAMRLLVPLGRGRDEFAVAVAGGDVGHDDIWQRAGAVQLLARPRNLAAFRQLLQRASERGAVGALEAEGARNLAGADLSGLAGDEGEDLVPGGQGCGMRLGARGLGAGGLGAGTVHGCAVLTTAKI